MNKTLRLKILNMMNERMDINFVYTLENFDEYPFLLALEDFFIELDRDIRYGDTGKYLIEEEIDREHPIYKILESNNDADRMFLDIQEYLENYSPSDEEYTQAARLLASLTYIPDIGYCKIVINKILKELGYE